MLGFINASNEDLEKLRKAMTGRLQCRFKQRTLPDICFPRTTDVEFVKAGNLYSIYIDTGIGVSAVNTTFARFVTRGEISFESFKDMVAFLRSLRPLYDTPKMNVSCDSSFGYAYEEKSETDLFIQNYTELMSSEHFGNAAFYRKSVHPDEISSKLKETIYGQDNAIDQIAYKITLNRMRKESKLLTIALLGSTGTGKSETARQLANILTELYGIQYGFIEVSANEYFSDVSISRFFGAPPSYVGYGKKTILDPVRNNPYHVIVINEVEKAASTFMTGLMEAIDTGVLGMADNSAPIDLNKCIMVFTSNIPIDRRVYEAADDFTRSEMCRDAFTKHCKRPEISGKIGNFIVFMPLSDKARAEIIVKFIKQELDDFDLTLTYIDRSLLQSMLSHQSKYGARGIQNLVCDSLGRELLNKRIVCSDRTRSVKMSGTIDNIRLEIA